ncbi:amylase-binding adhesin AbpA [uncultured Streptococcus sp.]|uniref:amylase-binding adhesin AbpA n=1 Tax=uncultured Streptococcus sp. TaxID=83427 RepID=UPI0025D812C6|nr:amylase-binding adhesin AbpA [uncultured Streptococcus sp.]
MKKVLLTSAAVLAVFAAGTQVFAQGENPKNSNQLTQNSYVSWADAAEANAQVDAHSADIAAEAQNDPTVKAAANALAQAQDTVGHNHESDVAAAQSKYDEALSNATNAVRNKYIQKFQQTYVDAAKAEGRYYNESGVEANRTNDQRIEDDLIANGKKAANDKAEAKTAPSKEDMKKAQTSAEKVKKAEAKSKAAKENKAGSKAEAKTLPNTAAVK